MPPKQNHHRRSIRLIETDYSVPGFYFVTICTKNRECLFGEIKNREIKFSEMEKIANECWLTISKHFPNVIIDEFVIMPNHIHGIIEITDNGHDERRGTIYRAPTTTQFGKPIPGSIATILGTYKAAVTRTINRNQAARFIIWQRNYYEHIIRND